MDAIGYHELKGYLTANVGLIFPHLPNFFGNPFSF